MAADNDPDMKMMSARERAICSSLCFCLALSVLSGVAMIYLSVIIYIPSQREILSGFNEVGLFVGITYTVKLEVAQISSRLAGERDVHDGGEASDPRRHGGVQVRQLRRVVPLQGRRRLHAAHCQVGAGTGLGFQICIRN